MVVITDSDDIIDDQYHHSSTISKTISHESRDSIDCLAEENEVQMFAKHALHNKLFVGHYLERRLVDFLGSYRDVVIVHKSEVDLKKDLDVVKARLDNFYEKIWIGITGPHLTSAPSGVALWVKLQNLPFGHYWFQIKQVKFREREINLRLKVIRPLAVTDPLRDETGSITKSESRQSTSQYTVSHTSSHQSMTGHELVESVLQWKNTLMGQTKAGFTSYVTWHNLRSLVFFLVAFFMATASGMVYGVRFAGEFTLRFLREMSLFLQASTPIVLGVIDFFSKLVGGLYILLAMMWRGTPTPAAPPYHTYRTSSSFASEYVTPYPYRPKPIMAPKLQPINKVK